MAKGARVAAGDKLFELEHASETAALRQASQELQAARAQLADLTKGSRPEEIAALEAKGRPGRGPPRSSPSSTLRARNPSSRRAPSPASDYDRARLTHQGNTGAVDEDAARLQTARLGGRSDAIAAAGAQVRAAVDAEAHARWAVDQKEQAAPTAALVYDTLYREGEYAGPGKPRRRAPSAAQHQGALLRDRARLREREGRRHGQRLDRGPARAAPGEGVLRVTAT